MEIHLNIAHYCKQLLSKFFEEKSIFIYGRGQGETLIAFQFLPYNSHLLDYHATAKF